MEPILKNTYFSRLLRIWKFLVNYSDFLELDQINNSLLYQITKMSFYELLYHIQMSQTISKFIEKLIISLIRKVSIPVQITKRKITAMLIAKQNKFNFFNQLSQISSFQLGKQIIDCLLQNRSKNKLSNVDSFYKLKLQQKLIYLSTLVDLVQLSDQFQNQYLPKIKKQFAQRIQKQPNNKKQIETLLNKKLNPHYFIGVDSKWRSYHYFPLIQDRILIYDLQNKQWNQMFIGQTKLLITLLIKKQQKYQNLSAQEIILLNNLGEIYQRLQKSQQSHVFRNQKIKKQFINQNQQKIDKIQILKQKIINFQFEYSKFICDCYNFRWGTKERRKTFLECINKCQTLQGLSKQFSAFFQETKNRIQSKKKKLDQYDHHLDSVDCQQSQFKDTYIRLNYLYLINVFYIAEKPQKTYNQNLYDSLKSFYQKIEKSEEKKNDQNYQFEYLYVFLESMLGIVNDLYPKSLLKRQKFIQIQNKKLHQKQEAEKNIKRLGKSKKIHQINQFSSSENQQVEQQKDKNKNQQKIIGSKRLRNKAKIFYGQNTKSSQQKTNAAKIKQNNKSKKDNKKIERSKRQTRTKKFHYLNIESSESQSNDSQNQGLNLKKYKFKEQSKDDFRRKLRSSN